MVFGREEARLVLISAKCRSGCQARCWTRARSCMKSVKFYFRNPRRFLSCPRHAYFHSLPFAQLPHFHLHIEVLPSGPSPLHELEVGVVVAYIRQDVLPPVVDPALPSAISQGLSLLSHPLPFLLCVTFSTMHVLRTHSHRTLLHVFQLVWL